MKYRNKSVLVASHVSQFEKRLKSHLGDLNKRDASQHQLKWSVRRPTRNDQVLRATACLVIELAQCDPETEVDTLPTYEEASEHREGNHVMVHMGQRSITGGAPPPNYTDIVSMASNYELQVLSTSISSPTIYRLAPDQSSHSIERDP